MFKNNKFGLQEHIALCESFLDEFRKELKELSESIEKINQELNLSVNDHKDILNFS